MNGPDDASGAALTRNAFLGGQLQIWQPRGGYRAGVDPVLLAASVPARQRDTVLELGCGVGVASLCLARRIAGVQITGLEVQPDYADLARRNAQDNAIAFDVLTGDLAEMPEALRQMQFNHVIANPPYFDRAASTPAQNPGREVALGEGTPLSEWVSAAAKRAAPKGYVTFIQRADRLPELLAHAARHLGSLEVMPLIARRGRAARLVLLRGRKNGRAAFRMHDGWVLHDGAAHVVDGEDYNAATGAILRLGAALPFPAASD